MTALPTVELDPPTISMTFGVNDSPLAGRDGTHVSLSLFFSVIMNNAYKSISACVCVCVCVCVSRIRW